MRLALWLLYKIEMEYESKLKLIQDKRQEIYRLTMPMVLLLLVGFGVQFVFAPLALIFGVLVFILFYKRLLIAARLPCPKCKEPFGSNSNFILGPGPDWCQNCGLGLYKKNRENI